MQNKTYGKNVADMIDLILWNWIAMQKEKGCGWKLLKWWSCKEAREEHVEWGWKGAVQANEKKILRKIIFMGQKILWGE